MVYSPLSLTRRQYPGLPFALVGAMAVSGVVLTPARAIANDFLTCGRLLTEAGLDTAAISAACGQALRPEAMARCVADITADTEIAAPQALAACQRDRRPQDLATCVTTLHLGLEVAADARVLGNCQRSLLPVRYADCVVGLMDSAALPAEASLEACMAAGRPPADLPPTFMFAN
jgi:hypothetical protein